MRPSSKEASKSALLVLFLVTMIDMIGFGIIIPFLTYLVKDLAQEQGVVEIGLWVGLVDDCLFCCTVPLFTVVGYAF